MTVALPWTLYTLAIYLYHILLCYFPNMVLPDSLSTKQVGSWNWTRLERNYIQTDQSLNSKPQISNEHSKISQWSFSNIFWITHMTSSNLQHLFPVLLFQCSLFKVSILIALFPPFLSSQTSPIRIVKVLRYFLLLNVNSHLSTTIKYLDDIDPINNFLLLETFSFLNDNNYILFYLFLILWSTCSQSWPLLLCLTSSCWSDLRLFFVYSSLLGNLIWSPEL